MNGGNPARMSDTNINRPGPNCQGQISAVNNNSGSNGSLMAAGLALANIPCPDGIGLRTTTFRTNEAMGEPLPE